LKTYSPEEIKQEQEDIGKEFEEAMKRGGVNRVLEIWHHRQNEWKNQKVTIAIIGQTGTGKSSFINAVFEKWTRQPKGPAKTGLIDTTKESFGYEHRGNSNIVLFDLPGVGGTKEPVIPKDKYLDVVKVDVYDIFLLMTSTRFSADDEWMGQQLLDRSKTVIFVRTKIGIDIDNSKHDDPKADEETVLATVKKVDD